MEASVANLPRYDADSEFDHSTEDQSPRRRLSLVVPKGYAKNRKPVKGPDAEATYDVVPEAVQLFMDKVGEHLLLTTEEEIELAKEIERGDLAAKDRMINSNLRLVVMCAKGYQNQGLTFNDLIQEGTIGLVRATELFDWRKGNKFSTYAVLWIRQALGRAIDDKSRLIRFPASVSQKERKIGRVERELATEFGREPTDEEVAAVVDMKLDKVKEIRNAGRVVTSLDRPVGEDEETTTTFGDMLALEQPSVEEEVEGDITSATLLGAIEELPEPERTVIKVRFGINDDDGTSLKVAGRKIGVSTERALQIENRALNRLSQETGVIALKAARN